MIHTRALSAKLSSKTFSTAFPLGNARALTVSSLFNSFPQRIIHIAAENLFKIDHVTGRSRKPVETSPFPNSFPHVFHNAPAVGCQRFHTFSTVSTGATHTPKNKQIINN